MTVIQLTNLRSTVRSFYSPFSNSALFYWYLKRLMVTANVPGLAFPLTFFFFFLPKERSLLKLTYSEKMRIKSPIARELLRKRDLLIKLKNRQGVIISRRRELPCAATALPGRSYFHECLLAIARRLLLLVFFFSFFFPEHCFVFVFPIDDYRPKACVQKR